MSGEKMWDLIVIGAGSAGLVASRTAAGFGARVLLIEGDRMGGDCLWTGCVPSKSLIAAAHLAAAPSRSAAFGVSLEPAIVDFRAVMGHVREAIDTIAPVDSSEAIEATGATVRHGRATFTGPRTLTLDDRELRFRQAVIATGSAPTMPPIEGIEHVPVLTSDTVWELESLPRSLVILGGGAIGCELAQAFARLGSEVSIVQRSERLLPQDTPQASALVRAALERDGVRVLTSRTAARFASSGDGAGAGSLHLADGSSLDFDRALVAVGRTPRTRSLGLAAAGVHLTDRGHVVVDGSLRTTNRRIWAAGDVTGLQAFTHTAGVNGSLAASNAVLGLRRSADAVVPHVTFTDPEVAAVGIQSHAADPRRHRVVTRAHEHTDRAVAEGATEGFTELVVDRSGHIVGGTIVGPRAGESLGELALAVRNRLTTADVAKTIHAYPTYSDALWNAAVVDLRERLGSGATAWAVQALRRMRSAAVR